MAGSGAPHGRTSPVRATKTRSGTGLHADQAKLQTREEPQHLLPAGPAVARHRTGCINSVDLEQVLGQIEPDRGNIFMDGSLHRFV